MHRGLIFQTMLSGLMFHWRSQITKIRKHLLVGTLKRRTKLPILLFSEKKHLTALSQADGGKGPLIKVGAAWKPDRIPVTPRVPQTWKTPRDMAFFTLPEKSDVYKDSLRLGLFC